MEPNQRKSGVVLSVTANTACVVGWVRMMVAEQTMLTASLQRDRPGTTERLAAGSYTTSHLFCSSGSSLCDSSMRTRNKACAVLDNATSCRKQRGHSEGYQHKMKTVVILRHTSLLFMLYQHCCLISVPLFAFTHKPCVLKDRNLNKLHSINIQRYFP